MGSKEVAETCFAFLHMELVRMALGGDTASISTPELQQAGRSWVSKGTDDFRWLTIRGFREAVLGTLSYRGHFANRGCHLGPGTADAAASSLL